MLPDQIDGLLQGFVALGQGNDGQILAQSGARSVADPQGARLPDSGIAQGPFHATSATDGDFGDVAARDQAIQGAKPIPGVGLSPTKWAR